MNDPGATTAFPNPSPGRTEEANARPGASTANNQLDSSVADGSPKTRFVPLVDHPSDAGRTGAHTPGGDQLDTDRTGPHTPSDEARQISIPEIPGYEILGVLGKGGMGVVFKARQIGLDRIVALKMILAGAHASSEAIGRFDAEARAVARFQHPNIIQIYEIGQCGDMPYFSLEFVNGGTLSRKIAREPQEPRYAAAVVETLARAMHYAHERNVIHRDLKPANVLLAEDGLPKITDFGLAKRLEQDSGQTHGGTVLGTPSYMAPEQAAGELEKVGPLADVYALGATLYDLLTGRPPFVGSSVLNTLEMVRRSEPVSPAQLAGKVPRDIETICLKCLQKEPGRRYASALALADDLKCFLDGKPIAARPIGRHERAWRWARRNPREAVLGSAAVLLLIATAVVGSVLSWRLNIAKGEAEQNAITAGAERDAKELQRIAAEAARRDAEAARAATADQRNVSLDVLRGVLGKVDNSMRNQAALVPLRQQILDAVMIDLPKIRDSIARNPLEGRLDATAYSKAAELLLAGNKVAEASELYNRTAGILEQLARENPDDPALTSNLAAINNLRGEVFMRQGKYLQARDLFARGLEIRRHWATLPGVQPAVAEAAYAKSRTHLGKVNLALGDPAAALEHYSQAKKHLQAVPEDPKSPLANPRELALTEERIGQSQFKLGNFDEAQKHIAAALAARQDHLKRSPRSPTLLRDEAVARTTLGDFYLTGRKDAAQANKEYLTALATFQRLQQAELESLEAQRDVAWLEYRLGVTAQRLARADTPEARRHFETALKLRESLARIDVRDMQSRIEWMLCLARAGRGEEAEKLAAEVRKTGPTDPQVLFQVACGLALASASPNPNVAGRCREEAFKVLGDLVQSGWKDQVTLETDPDLDPIRADARLAKLVAGLKAVPEGRRKARKGDILDFDR